MTSKRLNIRALRAAMIVAMLLMALSACNTSGCFENRNAIPLADFLSSQGQKFTPDSLEISGINAPGDKVLKTVDDRKQQVYLPMRPTADYTAWCFAYRWKALDYPQLCDTLAFEYESIPYFDSEECGATYRYLITRMRYTTHLIDSIAIVDSLITNVDRTYLKIYFRTAEPDKP